MLLNSDVLFAPRFVKDMLVPQRESVLLIDDVKPLAEEDMKVMVDVEGRITAIADILADHPIYSLSTQGLPWIEIDTHEDLACAAEIAQKIDKMEV